MAIPKHPTTTTGGHSPIVIAGGGCVGLFLALLLSQSPQPIPILVVEPNHPDPTSTRAMAHQPPTFPLFAQIPGLLPELIAAGSLSEGLCFRTSVRSGSRVIASKTFDNSGEGVKGKGQLLLPQGEFQRVLLGRLKGVEGVEVRLGWSVTGFTQGEGSGLVVQLSSGAGGGGETENVAASFLVGADGAHSCVRKCMGVELAGETLDAQLVATDLRFPFKQHGFFDANFVVDQDDYGLIGRIDDAGLWRVSYGAPGSQSEDEIRRQVPEKLRAMLPRNGQDKDGNDVFEVVRVAPYRAQQRCVDTLVKGGVVLVGDAAHCMSLALLLHIPHSSDRLLTNSP